jgi:hypothetical protein
MVVPLLAAVSFILLSLPEPLQREEGQLEAAAPRIGTFLVGLAAVYDNNGPLDNYFPCPRRGLVIYGGNASGRFVSFQGCDLGGDVVVEGEGTLRWDPPAKPDWDALCARAPTPVEGYASACGKTLSWAGPLVVSVDGRAEVHPNRLNMRIAWQPPVGPRAGVRLESEALDIDTQGIYLVSFEMEADGRVIRVGEEALPRDLFDFAALTLESIANPSRSIDALSEADQQRLVLDGVLRGLGSLLIDEVLVRRHGRRPAYAGSLLRRGEPASHGRHDVAGRPVAMTKRNRKPATLA